MQLKELNDRGQSHLSFILASLDDVMRVGCSGSRLHTNREVLLKAARRLETSRFARVCFHVRRDLLTEFPARIPFESFSGLILEQLST